MKRLTLFVLGTLLAAVGCSRREEVVLPDAPPFLPTEITSAYIALVERPDAKSVFLLGPEAKRLEPYFDHAGVRPSLALDGKFDIIVVSCGEMSEASCGKVAEHLTEDGVMVWLMDMRETTVTKFRSQVQAFAFGVIHLWMPGEARWVLVGRRTFRRIRLSAMLDVFARERTFEDLARGHCGTLPELFANYVGTRTEVVPAFAFLDPKAVVRPENFVTRDVPRLDWISDEETDADIVQSVRSEMRSMQTVRRVVFEGNRLAEVARDKKGEESATDVWAKAALRNPNDLILLERINRLERNAKGFLENGKVLQAMKCYETIVLIRPNDPVAIHNFGMCLKRIGKLDLAEKVLARARKIEEAVK